MTNNSSRSRLLHLPFVKMTKENNCVLRIPKSCREEFKKYRDSLEAHSYGQAMLIILQEVEYSRNIIKALSKAILDSLSGINKKRLLEKVNKELSSYERHYYDYIIEHYVKNNP